jgi:hypothetical protein
MNGDHPQLWIGLSILLLATPALALSWDLPAGSYERDARPGELQKVQIQDGKKLRLIFAAGAERALVVIETVYRMTAQKFSDYNVTAEVRVLSQGKRRVGRVQRMGLSISEGQKLSFTTSFFCAKGHEQMQFCLHDEIAGKPHVVCHELIDRQSRCQAPPPRPPGEMINPPPNAAVINDDKDGAD